MNLGPTDSVSSAAGLSLTPLGNPGEGGGVSARKISLEMGTWQRSGVWICGERELDIDAT